MLKITVQRDGTGDFTTISEAVLAVPYECEAEIEIGPGIYREKLVCEKQNITLRGAGADQTRVVWGDGWPGGAARRDPAGGAAPALGGGHPAGSRGREPFLAG